MTTARRVELAVIGGGPAGVVAALRARELGAEVMLLERNRLGGTCTDDGCAPTRVLARAARLARDAQQFPDYGLSAVDPAVDFARLIERTQRIVYLLHEKKQLKAHLERAGVTVVEDAGSIRFRDAHHLLVGQGLEIEAERAIICAGGHATRLPIPGAERALTHSDVWSLRRLPRSVAVVGAAATGTQLASVFADFGAQVVLLDRATRILPGEDEQTSQAMRDAFARRGIEVVTGIEGLERIEARRDGCALVYTDGDGRQTLEVERVLFAVGWSGNLEGLGLEAAAVETERGYIRVDDQLRTSASNIFAAGDITGRAMLVQTASSEGRIAAENAVNGEARRLDRAAVPHGGFTDPEYAGVGLTELAASERGGGCLVGVVPYAQLDRAVIDGRTEGFCKLIVAADSRILLGAHVVGEQAVEVVQLIATAMAAGMRIEQLARMDLAYPTFTAIVGLAARQIVHQLDMPPSATSEWEPLPIDEWERRELEPTLD